MAAEAQGIVSTEIIFRTAVEAGIRELRLYPFLLDYAFRSLVDDAESARVYGQALVDAAKRWFLKTQIEVIIADGTLPPKYPCVALTCQGGSEDEATLGNVHNQPAAPDDTIWPVLADLGSASYDPASGVIVLPDAFPLVVVPGMIVVDATGRAFPVLSVTGAGVSLGVGARPDLLGATVRGARPARAAALRSVWESESWEAAALVVGEPSTLTWLFAILKFVLYRNRDAMADRGLRDPLYGWGGRSRHDPDGGVPVWERTATIKFSVEQIYPQEIVEVFQGLSTEFIAGRVGQETTAISEDDDEGIRIATS